MRRLLSELGDYATGLARATSRSWNAFFFTPADPTPLGLIRVLVGLLLCWNLAIYGLDLRAYLGSDAWLDADSLRAMLSTRMPWAWTFWLWVPDSLLWPAWALCMLLLALYTLGLGSRVTAVLAWAIAVSTTRRAPESVFGFDQIVSTWALYLAVTGASGQAVSLDRFLARLRQTRAEAAKRRGGSGTWVVERGVPAPTVSANLALRLIQLHLVFIYGMAGLAKLQGPAWWNGMAAWGVVASGEFRRFDLTWLAAHPYLLSALTHMGHFLELSYPVLIWNRRLRPLLMGAMVLLHMGIDLTLGLTEFGLAMIAGNLAFVSGKWMRSLVTGQDEGQPAGRVLYDGACPRCRASMALVKAADPDHVVEPVDLTVVDVVQVHKSLTRAACMQSMHLVRADGRIDAGFYAVRTLLRWLPLGWPFALVCHLPGMAWVGRRVYNAVAASRPRDVPCTDETCQIHTKPQTDTHEKEARRAAPSGRSSP